MASVGEYYDKRIASSEAYIQEKQEENAQYAQQEEQERGLKRNHEKRMAALKSRMNNIQNKLENFIREFGIFNLDETQQRTYSQMMDERGLLKASLKDATSLRYDSAHKIIALSNRQHSNFLSIFNETLEIGDLRNQQTLFST